jgi:cell fate regulator YaaT (PSP1 superfamily)
LATYGKPRFLGIVELDEESRNLIKKERLMVVHSHRGEEFAEMVGPLNDEQESEYRSLRTISEHGEGPVRGGDPVVTDLEFVRVPSDDDIVAHDSHIAQEDENLHVAQELVEWHKLSIKLIDDEMLLDGKKLFFYFTSEQRVDFRTLVRDLARRFRTRIELRQMGVRDEARIIRGISSCGLPCCCSYWLNQFAPIGIKMVKEQNIALNPSKISGICGRLMCCMSFEHKVYREMWTGLPGPGSKIKTPNGNYIVLSLDIARNAVRCHKPTGGDIAVPKDLFADFKQAVMNGEDWEVPEEAQAEMATCRKTCSSCGSRGAIRGLGGTHLSIAPRSAEPAAEVLIADDAGQADPLEKSAHRRQGRRRARKGGRKTFTEDSQTTPAVPRLERTDRVEKPRSAEIAKRVPEHTVRVEPQAVGESQGDASRRPRRRRRRPRQPSGPGRE